MAEDITSTRRWEDTIKMDVRWTEVTEDSVPWQALILPVLNARIVTLVTKGPMHGVS